MKKLHGAFMVVAWLLLASVGTFFPRYLKQTWGERRWMDLDRWLQVHWRWAGVVVSLHLDLLNVSVSATPSVDGGRVAADGGGLRAHRDRCGRLGAAVGQREPASVDRRHCHRFVFASSESISVSVLKRLLFRSGLAFLQPLMAALRPAPGTPRRPFFNTSHALVGYSTHALAGNSDSLTLATIAHSQK